MIRLALVVIAVTLALGCSKKTDPKGPGLDRDAVDALWRLAPADADLGVVFAPGALARVLGDVDATLSVIEASPQAAPSIARIRAELDVAGGPNLLDLPAWRSRGLDPARGAALFLKEGGPPVGVVLPVVDRAAFVKSFQGKTTADIDEVGGMRCRATGEHYFCAPMNPTPPVKPSKLAMAALASPEAYRGHVELVVTEALGSLTNNPDVTGLVGALRFERGTWSARAWVQGKMTDLAALRSVKLPAAHASQLAGKTLVARLHLDRAPLVAKLPEVSLPGMDLRGGLVERITGDVLVSFGAGGIEANLVVDDGARVERTVLALCGMLKIVPGTPVSDVKMDDHGCSAKLAAEEYLSPALPASRLVMRVVDETLVVTLAFPGTPGDVPERVAGSTAAEELLHGEQSAVVWMRTLELGPAMNQALKVAGAEAPDMATTLDAYDRAASRVYEVGVGVRAAADGAHLMGVVTTMAADEDEVVRAYEAALAARFAGDDAGYREAAGKLVKEHPESRAAAHYALLGSAGSASAVGFLAAIAIPSFVKYIRHSKTVEAKVNLERILTGAHVRFVEDKVVVASVGPVPEPGSCCKQPGMVCAADPAVWADPRWQSVNFAIGDPHYYSYELVTERGKDGSVRFLARAIGDLDCDGDMATFELGGTIDAAGTWTRGNLRTTSEIE